jgi:hypothetical protein
MALTSTGPGDRASFCAWMIVVAGELPLIGHAAGVAVFDWHGIWLRRQPG